MARIDLNSDVGDSFGRWTLGDDQVMFRSVTSANVACGFHAVVDAVKSGDPRFPIMGLHAVLDDPAEVAEHVLQMATDSALRTVDGSVLNIRAENICVHGDSPGAVAMATAVKSALTAAGVTVAAFA